MKRKMKILAMAFVLLITLLSANVSNAACSAWTQYGKMRYFCDTTQLCNTIGGKYVGKYVKKREDKQHRYCSKGRGQYRETRTWVKIVGCCR